MIQSDPIVRLAAKGDGVTASGRHVSGAVPGDALGIAGDVVPGPHRAVPPCRHFGRCGGCQLQHCDEEVLARFVADRVVNAATGQGLEPDAVLPTHLSPPRTRRRTALHAAKLNGGVALGFREAGSHRIVDMQECHVLHPALFALLPPLRQLLHLLLSKGDADVHLTHTPQGVDCLVKGALRGGLETHEALLAFAQEHGLARLSLDSGWGAETLWEPQPVTVVFSGVEVGLPVGAFLQATLDGERVLQDDVKAFVNNCPEVTDLFAGLGTLSLGLAAGGSGVTAFEAERSAHLASRDAFHRLPGSSQAVHRDLFRAPLQPLELKRFKAVILDPPRAGAKAQVEQLAASAVERIAYVSCNPASWARDARVLCAAGYRLARIRAVGQFRWSTHVELTSLFTR